MRLQLALPPIAAGEAFAASGASCSVAGEFTEAIASYLNTVDYLTSDERKLIVRLLCSSKAFQARARILNQRYVNFTGKTFRRHCKFEEWRKVCGVNARGMLTKGPLKGKLVLDIESVPAGGSEFSPAASVWNQYGDRNILWIEDPPFEIRQETGSARRLGWLIRLLAHESLHAFRHVEPKKPLPKTAAERISAAIDDEIEARLFDQTVIRDIWKTRAGKVLSGFRHPAAEFFAATGSRFRLNDRFIVERSRFPGHLRLTYLEFFALSELMTKAIAAEALKRPEIEATNKRVDNLRALELKEIWELRDAVKHGNSYEKLRYFAKQMHADWTRSGHSLVDWNRQHEELAQRHACVFRALTEYTPHPDPAIRVKTCPRPHRSAPAIPPKMCVGPGLGSLDAEDADLCATASPSPGSFYRIRYGDTLHGITARAYRPEYDSLPVSGKVRLAKLINEHPYNRQFWSVSLADNVFPDGRISFGNKFRGAIELPPRPLGQAPRGRSYATIYIPKTG
jgi:hypothetical protein